MSAPSTLQAIRTKTRKLVGSPSPTQLTDPSLDEYINTFLIYDLPENLRLFQLHQPYIFYTQPHVDSYAFDRNAFLTINPPVYIAGYYSFWSSSQEQFYRIYPQLNNLQQVASGDGTTGPYSFTIPSAPILRGYTTPGTSTVNSNVLLAAPNTPSPSIIARDNGQGGWIDEDGNIIQGSIDYVTGAVTIIFPIAIPPGAIINAQSIPYQPARPEGLLFYNDVITLRPVPDQVYKVEIQGFIAPSALIAANQSPLLNEWWQYIAFGAAKKILEDRLDVDGWAKIQPFYNEQERLVLRRTLVQQGPDRTSTIYTEMTAWPAQNAYNRF
jgi:hypothetical protein